MKPLLLGLGVLLLMACGGAAATASAVPTATPAPTSTPVPTATPHAHQHFAPMAHRDAAPAVIALGNEVLPQHRVKEMVGNTLL
jgi:hypothetical protein